MRIRFLLLLLLTPCPALADPASVPEDWALHGQATFVEQ
jgi:hypothetical protein